MPQPRTLTLVWNRFDTCSYQDLLFLRTLYWYYIFSHLPSSENVSQYAFVWIHAFFSISKLEISIRFKVVNILWNMTCSSYSSRFTTVFAVSEKTAFLFHPISTVALHQDLVISKQNLETWTCYKLWLWQTFCR